MNWLCDRWLWMRWFSWFCLAIVLAGTVQAQDFPFKPLPTVRVRVTCGTDVACQAAQSVDAKAKWWIALPVRRPTATAAFWARTAVSGALTVGDVENSIYSLQRPGTTEKNWLYGSHPTRARYYPIAGGIAVLCAYMDWRYTREDNALRDASMPSHRFVKGYIPQVVNMATHIAGIIYTVVGSGR